jgi:hypothetical protein
MSAGGWIRVEVGVLERFANVLVCVAGKWGRAGQTFPAPAGRARVEMRAVLHAPLPAQGELVIETFVAPGRITTLRLPPLW